MNALLFLRRTIAALAAVAALGVAIPAQAAGDGVALDTFPTHKLLELPALQDGARTFVNYCLNCHGASMMRYNRLRDIGLSEAQITEHLLFTGRKVGDPMQVALRPNDAKEWFGALPPDLSVIARARSSAEGSGSDWLFTYLRSFYRDDSRAIGWNNAVFPNVGMPHVLWEWQGSRGATVEEIKAVKDEKTGEGHGFSRTVVTYDNAGTRLEKTEKLEGGGHPHEGTKLTLTPATGGSMNQASYDEKVANLVAFLTYVSDPTARTRVRMGVWVLMFLGLLVFLTWWLNREYWKDIK
jgi:ubiquinol-cytochrome c reductase cytochrome c1 subunit